MSHSSCSKKSCSKKESPPLPPSKMKVSTSRNEIRPFSSASDEYGENQSDSSASNSSLASSPRYNERHPRVLESVRKRSSGRLTSSNANDRGGGTSTLNSGAGGGSSSSQRGSFVMLASRTSLPPLDENCPLDGTESQLSLNLRRATRSSSWTNQKILDAIDGLNTCAHEIDPCLAVMGGKNPCQPCDEDESNKNESPRRCSFEKFVVPRSISNLIMRSRSSGNVNPAPVPGQNRENSNYNFLSGIREVDDEEMLQQDETTGIINITLTGNNTKLNSGCTAAGGGGSAVPVLNKLKMPNADLEGVPAEE